MIIVNRYRKRESKDGQEIRAFWHLFIVVYASCSCFFSHPGPEWSHSLSLLFFFRSSGSGGLSPALNNRVLFISLRSFHSSSRGVFLALCNSACAPVCKQSASVACRRNNNIWSLNSRLITLRHGRFHGSLNCSASEEEQGGALPRLIKLEVKTYSNELLFCVYEYMTRPRERDNKLPRLFPPSSSSSLCVCVFRQKPPGWMHDCWRYVSFIPLL